MTKETFAGLLSRTGDTIQITIRYKKKKYYETINSKPTLQNMRAAKKLRDQIHDQLKSGFFNYKKTFPQGNNADVFSDMRGDNITIAKRLDVRLKEIMDDYDEGIITRSSMRTDKKAILVLIEEFGKMQLSDLTTDHLEYWADKIGIVSKTLSNRMTHMRRICYLAKKDGEIPENIFAGWKAKVKKKSKHVKKPFSLDEYLEIMKSIKKVAPDSYSFFAFRFAMGMRPSEIFGLTWKRYDKKNQTITIVETIVDGHKEDKPKTEAGIRTLKLNKIAAQAINHQATLTDKKEGLIFKNPNTDDAWTYRPISTRWKAALKHAGVKYRVPYTTRHTFATLLIKSGEVDLYGLSTALGHKDIATTTDAYIGTYSEEANLSTLGIDKAFRR